MSTPVSTRDAFQQLADTRLTEAKLLLDAGMWDGAYYIAGYAAEVGLKARIIKQLMATDAFPDKDLSKECYTHNLAGLLKVAGLKPTWDADTATDADLFANWVIASKWSEVKRYHRISESEARELYAALTDPAHGVFPWIKTHW